MNLPRALLRRLFGWRQRARIADRAEALLGCRAWNPGPELLDRARRSIAAHAAREPDLRPLNGRLERLLVMPRPDRRLDASWRELFVSLERAPDALVLLPALNAPGAAALLEQVAEERSILVLVEKGQAPTHTLGSVQVIRLPGFALGARRRRQALMLAAAWSLQPRVLLIHRDAIDALAVLSRYGTALRARMRVKVLE